MNSLVILATLMCVILVGILVIYLVYHRPIKGGIMIRDSQLDYELNRVAYESSDPILMVHNVQSLAVRESIQRLLASTLEYVGSPQEDLKKDLYKRLEEFLIASKRVEASDVERGDLLPVSVQLSNWVKEQSQPVYRT